MSKQLIISNIIAKLNDKNIPYIVGNGTDISIANDFLDASWGTGKKTIRYEANIFLDENTKTIFMWEMTKETGSGLSFGSTGQSSFQSGSTLFRKVKMVQYGPDGKEFEVSLDLGAIPKVFKESAKEFGWNFKTVLKKEKALNPEAYNSQPSSQQPPVQKPPVQQQPPAHQQQPIQQSPPLQQQSHPNSPRPYNINTQNQVNNNIKQESKKNKASILYWILFGLLVIFDAIMIMSGFGIIVPIGSIIILAGFGILSRWLTKGYGKTIIGFLMAVILTFSLAII